MQHRNLVRRARGETVRARRRVGRLQAQRYCRRPRRRLAASNTLADIETVADARRPLLAYAALVLEYIIRIAKPKTIVFSTYGVREGLLYEMLPEKERQKDGLIATAHTLNELRSRSP